MTLDQQEPAAPAKAEPGPDIRRADIAGFGPVWNLPIQAGMAGLVVASLALSIVFLPIALAVYWVFLTTAAYMIAPKASTEWIIYASALLALLTASGVSYLLQDWLLLSSNRRARRLLRAKAERVRGAPLPPESSFVQFESAGAWPREGLRPDDVGWLTIEADRLTFVGDRLCIDLPKGSIRAIRRGPHILRLTSPACIDIAVAAGLPGDGRLRLIPRMADRMSDAPATLAELEKTLKAWYAG